MSVTQANASSLFLEAMGPMVGDVKTMSQVLAYIALLRHQAEPCQYTTAEMHDVLADSINSVKEGNFTSHDKLKKEIAQWL